MAAAFPQEENMYERERNRWPFFKVLGLYLSLICISQHL